MSETFEVVVAVASGLSTLLVTMVLKQISDVARDVKEIRTKVDDHAEKLAEGEVKIDQLRKDVDGLLERERARITG